MRFFIIICLLFTSFSVSAQPAEKSTAPAAKEAINKVNDFISDEIEKEWTEHVTKLHALAKEFKVLRLKLRQIKLEILLAESGEVARYNPPYTFPSDRCEKIPSLKDVNRCVWYFKNSSATHICEVWWINEIEMWHQENSMECRKLAIWTRDDTGGFGYQAP
jgi:hypothetical protein